MSSSPTLDNGSSKTATTAEPPTHLILQMALRDVSVLFRTPWIIITRALAFIIQLFVFAFLISGLIHIQGLNFFEYYAVGSVVATIASISFVIGYDIFEEAEEGVLDYLLTLPIPRRQFIIGRALGGAMRAIIYTIPMFLIVAFMPFYVSLFAPFSPVSFAADTARMSLVGFTLDLPALAGLVAFVVIFLGLGAAFYFRRLEGGIYG